VKIGALPDRKNFSYLSGNATNLADALINVPKQFRIAGLR
jgi:hypothetical protein